jgi:hypothetical protein
MRQTHYISWNNVVVLFVIVTLGTLGLSSQGHSAVNVQAQEQQPVQQQPVNDLEPPFRPGEKLNFVLKWGKIPAGEASLEVRPINTVDGELAYHFVRTAKTNSVVDVFFKVRDKIESFTDLNMSRSLLYKKKQREGGYKRDVMVKFDWNARQAQSKRIDKNRTDPPIEIPDGAFDPLSALYFTRFADIQEGSTVERPVTDGSNTVVGVVKVLKKETLKIDGKRYETYKLQPSTEGIGGVFKESKDAKLFVWVTADERRIPVKVKSKVVVGSFVGELASMELGNAPVRLSGRMPPE